MSSAQVKEEMVAVDYVRGGRGVGKLKNKSVM